MTRTGQRLAPVVWLGIGVGLAVVAHAGSHWIVTALVLTCAVLLSLARGGPRVRAFAWTMVVGAVAFAGHLVVGALVGSVPPDPDVVVFLPEWTLGQGVAIGGPVSAEQLTVSLARGLDAWVLCALVGLMWQACAGSTWCDLAAVLFGRGSRLLAPCIFLGEALATVRLPPRGAAAALLDTDREYYDAWCASTTHSRPDPVHAAVAAVLLAAATALVYWVAMSGGLRVAVSTERTIVVSARMLAFAMFVVWCGARLFVAGLRADRGRCDLGARA